MIRMGRLVCVFGGGIILGIASLGRLVRIRVICGVILGIFEV